MRDVDRIDRGSKNGSGTEKTGKKVLETILEPLHAIEDVAMELTEGNLHSTLEYHSDDEIGKLAHSMRKSVSWKTTSRKTECVWGSSL